MRLAIISSWSELLVGYLLCRTSDLSSVKILFMRETRRSHSAEFEALEDVASLNCARSVSEL